MDRDLTQTSFHTPEVEYRQALIEPRAVGRFRVMMPYSEVCMSMRVCGKELEVEDVGHGMAQLFKDGMKFSAPITHGEAGIYHIVKGEGA